MARRLKRCSAERWTKPLPGCGRLYQEDYDRQDDISLPALRSAGTMALTSVEVVKAENEKKRTAG